MRIVFMGTPDFSVPALRALVRAGHELAAVVTQPDKPKGRGHEMQMPPVKLAARELGIPVYQPARVREPAFVETLRELKPEAIVVIAFGQILPKAILSIPPLGCINIHASLLPRYRGAAPIQWAIIDGETETGVTTMMMDAGLDTGDMLERVAVPIAEKETGGSLHDKLSAAGADLILTTLAKAEAGTLVRTPQSDADSCYAKLLTKSLGEIDWSRSAEAIERLIRGLNPWPSAYTHWNGRTLKLWAADVIREDAPELAGASLSAGRIALADKHRLVIGCGRDGLLVKELQLEGKKRMRTEEFLRGCPLQAGTMLGTTESE